MVERIRTEVGGVDRIVDVDFGKNRPVSAAVLKPHGAITCYASTSVREPVLPYNDLLRLNISIRPVFVYTMPDAAKAQAHADIARWVRKANPIFAIAERFSLAEVVQAHFAVERGKKIGHVLLAPL